MLSEYTKQRLGSREEPIKQRSNIKDVFGSTYVAPEGIPNKAKIVIIGEQPGSTEIHTGKPFVGAAGRVLNECLNVVGIARHDCYLTNVFKDLDHPLNYYWENKRGTPTYSEAGMRQVKYLLEEELPRTSAKVIVCFGNVPLSALMKHAGITKWRGSVLTPPDFPDRFVIPAIHPSTVNPPKNVYLNKFLIQFDLRRAKQVADFGFNPIPRRLITKPSFFDAAQYLEKMYELGIQGELIAFDIELYNEELSCISFASNENEAICIPFVDWEGDYFSIPQELEIMRGVAKILECPEIKKLGQNIAFDSHFLLRKYGIRCFNMEDTMIAQRTIMPEYPIGLDFITSVWTDQKYYKDEGKKYFGGGGWEQLWAYNCTDSLMCQQAFPKQYKKLQTQNNIPTYTRQNRMVPPIVFMQEYGVKINVEEMKRRKDEYVGEDEDGGRAGELELQLDDMAGRKLNPNSNKQLVEYFYGAGGHNLKAYKNRKSGNPSVDSIALKRLVRRGFDEAKLILEIRKLRKLASTYLNVDKVDSDGRIRCSYNPVGTKFSRLSSSANIFDTGMNLQNWPHELLDLMVADDGMVIYTIDLSQAENRIVAYYGGVESMIKAFEEGSDVHSLTASLIFNMDYNEVYRQDKEDINCPIGNGTHTYRFWGKKANHGLNYDLGYRTFALYYEIQEGEANMIVERYHRVYPGIRRNYHAKIRRQLRQNRTITNLMGRNTVFMDQWGDSLFKEAYSCVPQGTVGDVINERGIEYVYYDQDRFSDCFLQTQVHDSMSFQIPLPPIVPWRTHAMMLQNIQNSLETPLKTDEREFVIPTDITMGFTYRKENSKEIKGHYTEDGLTRLLEKNAEDLGWVESSTIGSSTI